MLRLIARRLLTAVPVLFGLLTITFFVIRLAPGDPMALYQDPSIDPLAMDELRVRLGLDEPLILQYGKWLGAMPPFRGILEGEWGLSFSHRQPVFDIIFESIPNTLILTITALALDLLLGLIFGIIAALNRDRWIDHAVRVAGMTLYSMPHFWFAIILIMIFSLWLGWLPASQMHSVNADLLGTVEYSWDAFLHLILPAIALGIPAGASTARYLRNHLLEVLRQDYIRTARAKGLPERTVILKHALPNALLPLITLLGLSVPFLLSGAVITEVVFAWPGMGRVTVDAIFTRDYPLIISTTFVAGTMVIAGNLLADILYGLADPRVR
jgi:peptide/nickel transport system permease protein